MSWILGVSEKYRYVKSPRSGGAYSRRINIQHRMLMLDPITNVASELRAPEDGRVPGMALNQVVMPGFAAFRIGIPTTESELASPQAVVPAEIAPTPEPKDHPEETAPSLELEEENS